jgi:hypothetical protein
MPVLPIPGISPNVALISRKFGKNENGKQPNPPSLAMTTGELLAIF